MNPTNIFNNRTINRSNTFHIIYHNIPEIYKEAYNTYGLDFDLIFFDETHPVGHGVEPDKLRNNSAFVIIL